MKESVLCTMGIHRVADIMPFVPSKELFDRSLRQ